MGLFKWARSVSAQTVPPSVQMKFHAWATVQSALTGRFGGAVGHAWGTWVQMDRARFQESPRGYQSVDDHYAAVGRSFAAGKSDAEISDYLAGAERARGGATSAPADFAAWSMSMLRGYNDAASMGQREGGPAAAAFIEGITQQQHLRRADPRSELRRRPPGGAASTGGGWGVGVAAGTRRGAATSGLAAVRDGLHALAGETESTSADLGRGLQQIEDLRQGVEAILDETTVGTATLDIYGRAITAVEKAIGSLGEASTAARDFAVKIMS